MTLIDRAPRTAPRARAMRARRATRAAQCMSEARTAVPPAASARAASSAVGRSATTRRRSTGTPAYFRRSASSAARVPAQVTRRDARTASSSKSASHIQETSRPSAVRSLRIASTSSSPGSSASVRRISLAPAGFLISRIDSSVAPIRTRSARPNAAVTPPRPAATVARRRIELEAQRRGSERVVDVVEARERQLDRERLGGCADRKPAPRVPSSEICSAATVGAGRSWPQLGQR